MTTDNNEDTAWWQRYDSSLPPNKSIDDDRALSRVEKGDVLDSLVTLKEIADWEFERQSLVLGKLVRNMHANATNHRYHGEWPLVDDGTVNNTYLLKDLRLLASVWVVVMRKGKADVNRSVVIPLDETSTKIQNRYHKVMKNNAEYWLQKQQDLLREYRTLKSLIRSDNRKYDPDVRSYIEASKRLWISVNKCLPKVNGKVVLDIQTVPSVFDITTQRPPKDTIGHRMLMDFVDIRFTCGYFVEELGTLSDSTNNIQHEYSWYKTAEHMLELTPENESPESIHNAEHRLVERLYHAKLDGNNKIIYLMACTLVEDYQASTTSLEDGIIVGCGAAKRLLTGGCYENSLNDKFMFLTPMIIYRIIKDKIDKGYPRPFFSTNKLKRLENELGIGLHSTHNYKCDECGAVGGQGEVPLRRCNGCKRVWYCSIVCQTKGWTDKHRQECGRKKWRMKPYSFRSKNEYEKTQEIILSHGLGSKQMSCNVVTGADISIEFNPTTLDVFAFCLDPKTNELFDGLTDRPLTYLPTMPSPTSSSSIDDKENMVPDPSLTTIDQPKSPNTCRMKPFHERKECENTTAN